MQEHPDVFVPDRDAIHFFTINYTKGLDWYHWHFQGTKDEKAVVDPTPSYLRDITAPNRIYEYEPQAKFIVSLRNPLDRAFSHYWHEKKKNKIRFQFSEAINYSGVGNYDLYSDWILTGFYFEWIQLYLRRFSADRFLFLIFDDLQKDPLSYIWSVYRFLEVDDRFRPKAAQRVINAATSRIVESSFLERVKRRLLGHLGIQNHSEYEKGIGAEIRADLLSIFLPEIEKLEVFLGRDLSSWKR